MGEKVEKAARFPRESGMFECGRCGKGPMTDGTTVYKNGSEYRCEQHLDPEYRDERSMQMAASVEQMGEAKPN